MNSSVVIRAITAILLLINQIGYGQSFFLQAFQQLSDQPSLVSFRNSQSINAQGGHIQGVQRVKDYYLLSGSSSTVSYFATVTQGEVVRVDTLLPRPYKHAGGFQVNGGLLVVGVEDNEAKNKSRVLVYDFSDPLQPLGQPLQVVQREDKVKRATAGCVAVASYQGQYILLVGDWDTRHLDLYQIPADQINNTTMSFKLIQSIALENYSRAEWVDENWWPYQNINLFHSDDKLYLVGLGINNQEENVADVYTLTPEPELHLVKVASRTFPRQSATSFLWGAGVNWQPEKERMRILATPYTISKENAMIIYE